MDNDILAYRAYQVQRSQQILKATVERRFPPDDAVDQRMADLELEVVLLMSEIQKEK